MTTAVRYQPARPAAVVFNLLDPIPFGFFVAALLFDLVYWKSGEIMWMKSAAWLIASGLLFAVVPRLINLGHVLFLRGRPRARGEVASFWLNLLAIVAAIVNAFVHSRDAYAAMPDGALLSIVTVLLMVAAKVISTPGTPTMLTAPTTLNAPHASTLKVPS